MLPRFYAPDAARGRPLVDLPVDEGRHLTRVLRLGVGAEVAVFDGVGHEFTARVERVARAGVCVRIVGAREPAPEPAVALTLVQGVLKGEPMDRVVRDAVMMGVAAIQPVTSEHGQVRLPALARGGGGARWQRIAVASVKQCRRAVVPPVHPARTLEDVVSEPPAAGTVRILLVEPALAGGDVRDASDLGREPAPRAAVVAVGSEGGWSVAEAAAAVAHGWRPVTLGRRTLRAEAVPIAAIAVLQFCWGDL